MKSILFFCLLFSLLLSTTSHAQTACPPGMEEYGEGVCGYSRSEEPTQQAPQQQAAPPQWTSRWGAIATDSVKAVLGTATDMASKNEAEQRALKECQTKGGTQCKLQNSYSNACVAMITGSKIFNVGSDADLNRAVQSGMKKCTAADTDCHVYYSACSLPVRIQ